MGVVGFPVKTTRQCSINQALWRETPKVRALRPTDERIVGDGDSVKPVLPGLAEGELNARL